MRLAPRPLLVGTVQLTVKPCLTSGRSDAGNRVVLTKGVPSVGPTAYRPAGQLGIPRGPLFEESFVLS